MSDIKRTVASDTLTEIAVDYTRPVYLIQMQFDSGNYYISTGPAITFETHLYLEGQVKVNDFSWTPEGEQVGSIDLLNENNAATALVLSNGVGDVPILIYTTYIDSNGDNTTPVLLVRGVMDSSTITPSKTTVTILSGRSSTSFIPKRYFTAAEGFNWLPADGDVVSWGNERFILESEF